VALRGAATRRLALAGGALALLPVAMMTLAYPQRLYLVTFLPLYALAAVLGLRAALRALPAWAHRPRTLIGALALLVMPSTLPALKQAADEARTTERRLVAERAALRPLAARGTPRPLFSDTPDFVAWTTGRPTFWISLGDFTRLYASNSDAPRQLGLPAQGEAQGWFHADARDPAARGALITP